jgi:hypothetical protein
MPTPPAQRSYDHRLIRLVQQTGDATIATRIGVPRSTVAGWLRRSGPDVVSAQTLDESAVELCARVARLERRVLRLAAMLRVGASLALGSQEPSGENEYTQIIVKPKRRSICVEPGSPRRYQGRRIERDVDSRRGDQRRE